MRILPINSVNHSTKVLKTQNQAGVQNPQMHQNVSFQGKWLAVACGTLGAAIGGILMGPVGAAIGAALGGGVGAMEKDDEEKDE